MARRLEARIDHFSLPFSRASAETLGGDGKRTTRRERGGEKENESKRWAMGGAMAGGRLIEGRITVLE